MATAEHLRAIVAPDTPEVSIAGVPWPRYKLVALLAGFAVLVVVGLVAARAAPSVLAAAATGTLVWLVLGFFYRSHNRSHR